MQTPIVPALVIRREYAAPPDRVYEAWTNPQLAKQFLCPEGMSVGDVSMDVRVGGAYKIEMLTPQGEPYIAYGVYREVVPPSRLSMTWKWQEDSPQEEHETLLTLEFNALGSGTEFILTHERLSSLESRNNHEHGWTSMLRKLYALGGSAVTSVEVAAPPQRVFDALASKEITQWWVRPGIFDTREWSGEVRSGGRWHASGVGRGQPYSIEGEFLEVRAPEKLVHTWQPVGNAAAQTTVTYELQPTEDGTRVMLHHDGFTSTDACLNTLAGWETSFERLSELFASGRN